MTGHRHMFREAHWFDGSGIIGAGMPMDCDAAFAAKKRGKPSVIIAFFGEG